MTKTEFILAYFKYLNTWNKSASLESMIYHLSDGLINYEFSELVSIAQFEYYDTQLMTTDYVMSLEEVMLKLRQADRDKKIDEIFKN